MTLNIPDGLKRFAKSAKAPIYAVGGFVRNALCSLGETDIDICGPVPPNALGVESGYRVEVVNYKLGTAVITNGKDTFEYTPFRTESYTGGEHTPTQVFFTSDIGLDCARRDFTANAVYYDIKGERLIDPTGLGIKDIEKKILRAVSSKTFLSDGLRILRLVRIAAQTGFLLEGETAKLAAQNSELLNDISCERKRVELEKILNADRAYDVKNAHYRGVMLLGRLNLWKYLVRQVVDCIGLEQPKQFHKYDVYEHTMQCVKFASSPDVRRAALFHDLGKAVAFAQKGNFHGHEVASEHITCSAMRELCYSNRDIALTAALVKNHMYNCDGLTRKTKLRLFVVCNFEILDSLVELMHADARATGMLENALHADALLQIRDELTADGTPLTLRELAVGGDDCVAIGLCGSAIGESLNALHKECVLNPRLNNREWLVAQLERLAKKQKPND